MPFVLSRKSSSSVIPDVVVLRAQPVCDILDIDLNSPRASGVLIIVL